MGLFTEREAAALAPPSKFKPSEWADEFRYLPPSVAAEAGRFRGSRTPYIAGIIDAVLEPQLEEIVVIKAAQVAFTTAIQTLLGWCIDQEPGPALLVMPSQDEARKIVTENILPLIENTPKVAAHVADGEDAITKEVLRFDSMPLYLGWAGSPQSLARRAARWVFLDEVDKYPPFSGKDAAPVALARARTRTFGHRARTIIGSTPTTRDGTIAKEWERCGDRRHYHIPCPHCGEFQRLHFQSIKFNGPAGVDDRTKRADAIEAGDTATYECEHCQRATTHAHKLAVLPRGVWLSEGQTIDRAGRIAGERPRAKRVGFKLSALYSPWVSFSQIAGAFLRAVGDQGAMMEFHNQWLGEIHEEVVTSIKVGDLRTELANAPQAGVLPPWAGALILSVDTQQYDFYYVLRAWGHGYKSQLIDHGRAADFAQLRAMLDSPRYFADSSTQYLTPVVMVIDSGGHRTDEVYNFSLEDQRIRPIKGASKPQTQPIRLAHVTKVLGVTLLTIDTNYFKDRLESLRRGGQWGINRLASEEYFRHLANEQKIKDRNNNRLYWQTITSGAPNHFLDCEVYNIAGAEEVGVINLATEAELVAHRKARETPVEVKATKPLRTTSDWLKRTNTTSWANPTGKRWN